MAKSQNTSSSNSNMMVWIVLVVLILAGLLLYKKAFFTDKTMNLKEDEMSEETMIKDTSDLDETSFEMDEANIDAEFDAELNLLEEDAEQIQEAY